MSVGTQTWVFTNSAARLADRLVLLALADEADDDGGTCYPSQRRLAAKARLSQTLVRKSIERLENAGEILVQRPDRPAPGKHSRYQLTLGRNPNDLAEQLGWPTPALDPRVRAEWASEPTEHTGAQSGSPQADVNCAPVGSELNSTEHPSGVRNRAGLSSPWGCADPLTQESDRGRLARSPDGGEPPGPAAPPNRDVAEVLATDREAQRQAGTVRDRRRFREILRSGVNVR